MKPNIFGRIETYLPLVLSLALFSVSHADTNVSGNITTDTTWTLANSPYIVTGTVQVFSGVTLTIESGVAVKFGKNTLLRIGGDLIAEGTVDQMITFTSNESTPTAGDWGPIEFVEGAVGSTLDENGEFVNGSIVAYCRIEFGKGISTNSGLFIKGSTICHNAGDGIHIDNTEANTIIGNTVSDNSGIGIYLTISTGNEGTVTSRVTGNTIRNNGGGGMYCFGGGDANVLFTITRNIVNSNAGNEYGMYVIGGLCTISENNISNNTGGLYVQVNGNVFRNTIANNAQWGVVFSGQTFQFEENSFSGNNAGEIYIGNTTQTAITNNNLSSDGLYTIYNSASGDIVAADNWWGTTNSAEIDSKIYDYYDDITKGEVIFQPIAQSAFPIPQTPPAAAFTASPLTGELPLSVSFTNQSSGSPTTCVWDFGDGETSAETNPAHVYTSPGVYTVKLTVSNAQGSDTETKSGYIQVRSGGVPEEAHFAGVTTNLTAFPRTNVPITFTAQVVNQRQETIYYKFWYRAGYGTPSYPSNPWIVIQDFSPANTCTYTFTNIDDYIVVVWATTDLSSVIADQVSITGLSVKVRN